ncbi:MAG: DMT family transporter [Ruminococcaceae bacterium]|nr:DMT family transporter [Oscillospiraceae bacterium]
MESTARKRNIASLQMLTCAALWSIAGIFIKLLDANGMVIAGFRSLIASLVFLVYIKKKRIKIVFNKDVLISAVFLAVTFFAFVWANRLTTAANAIVLQFTAPIFIIILSAVFFRQKYALCDIITVIFTLGGISLFFLDQLNGGQMLGNLIGLFSGFTMAGMFIAVKQNSASDRMSGMLFGHLLTAIIGIPFIFFTENTINTNFAMCILILGIVQLGIPYLLMALATEHCPPLTLSLLSAVEPLLNPVWVAIFYGEMPGIFAFIGGIIVIVTITVWCIYKELKLRNNRSAS